MTLIPQRFPGTKEEAGRNYASHDWGGIGGRCYDCDARPYHRAAWYPCGAEVPMIETEEEE